MITISKIVSVVIITDYYDYCCCDCHFYSHYQYLFMLICMEDVYMYTCVSVSMTYAKREDNCSANGSHTIKNFIQHNTPQCSMT